MNGSPGTQEFSDREVVRAALTAYAIQCRRYAQTAPLAGAALRDVRREMRRRATRADAIAENLRGTEGILI